MFSGPLISDEAMYHGLIAPIVNQLDYPVRAAAADLAASAPAMASLATGGVAPAGTLDQWWKVRDAIVNATELPENKFGHGISEAIGFIPGLGAKAVHGLSESLLGKNITAALGPAAQTITDVMPFRGHAVRDAVRDTVRPPPTPMRPLPAVEGAQGAGYRLAPEMASESPSLFSHLISATGKIKKEQEFSYHNQENTDRLTRRSLGLPEGTFLDEAAFERARQPAINAYRALEAAVPEIVTTADPRFRAEISRAGARLDALEAEYPETRKNPDVVELRQDMTRFPVNSPTAVRQRIAELREKAGRNFRKQDDAHAHQLGMAQREAAIALEDAVERSIMYSPEQIRAMRDVYSAQQEISRYQEMVREGSRATGEPVDVQGARARLRDAQVRVVRSSLIDPARRARAEQILANFRQGRELFARSYDLELATNFADGHVSARRVSNLRSGALKRNLSGEMEQIANAYDSFRKVMQDPESFGAREAWSILDLAGATASLATGHFAPAIATGMRWPTRAMLASRWYQDVMRNRYNRQVNPPTRVPTSPMSGYVQGTLAQPEQPDPSDISWRYAFPAGVSSP